MLGLWLAAALAAPLDLNRADAASLAALPGVGDAKAAAIVDYRDRHGPYHAVEDLDAVPGIGKATIQLVRTRLVVGPPKPEDAPSRPRPTAASVVRVDINRANAEELATLPGLGAKRAAAIVSDRATNGPFRSCKDLVRIAGFGQATIEAIKDRCEAR